MASSCFKETTHFFLANVSVRRGLCGHFRLSYLLVPDMQAYMRRVSSFVTMEPRLKRIDFTLHNLVSRVGQIAKFTNGHLLVSDLQSLR